MQLTLNDLRRFTVGRNFPKPTTLKRAVHRMGFVQADPIRAPARAQDLILRQRVINYRAGDLERRYASLEIEEDVFVNYGYVSRELQKLMGHRGKREQAKAKPSRKQLLLEFVRARGEVHPREVDEHFSHGTVKNYWGGSSNATTHLLDEMHYYGLLRVVRREKGIRIYASRDGAWESVANAQSEGNPRIGQGPAATRIDAKERRERVDALVDVVVAIYAPLTASSLNYYLRRLRYAVPQWQGELTAALQRAKDRLSHAHLDGIDWYWQGSNFRSQVSYFKEQPDTVRLLAPFDPVVHDRARFELLWGWAYRFEAYTPVSKRKLGYYALPLLWRERVIGWANVSVKHVGLIAEFGYVDSQPRDRAFKRELEAELDRLRVFLKT